MKKNYVFAKKFLLQNLNAFLLKLSRQNGKTGNVENASQSNKIAFEFRKITTLIFFEKIKQT
jgi:hypothetical protein